MIEMRLLMLGELDQFFTPLLSSREWSLLCSSVKGDSLLIRAYRREPFKQNSTLLNQYYLQINIISR